MNKAFIVALEKREIKNQYDNKILGKQNVYKNENE